MCGLVSLELVLPALFESITRLSARLAVMKHASILHSQFPPDAASVV